MIMTFCGNCGTELADFLKFCPNCGHAANITTEGSSPTDDIDENNAKSPSSFNDIRNTVGINYYGGGGNSLIKFSAKYLGGHSSYPGKKSLDTQVIIYDDVLEIERLFLKIPYSSMTNVGNMDVEKISALRVV